MELKYLEWNDMLAEHFFSEEKAGKEVLLYVNEPLIKTLGAAHGAGVFEFVEAVKGGPPWATGQKICQRALQAFKGWRSKDLDYPPYIGYLALFVLAGGKEGEYAPHAYYPRLWDLLGESGETGAPASFERMVDLWDDLEKWSREDQHENLGRFVARIRGQMWKVGLPLSQTLISEEERRHLLPVLSNRGLDPVDLPSPEVVLRILREVGPSLLKRRTVRVLKGEDKDSRILREALLDVVTDELEAWDGTVVDDVAPTDVRRTRTYLRLCLKINKLSLSVKCRVRIRTATTFPEDGCTLQYPNTQETWRCEECFGGWSSTLYDPDTDPVRELDGAKLSWSDTEQFLDKENGWIATLQPAVVRVFTPGSSDGLPDYVERQRLERNTRFLVAARDAYISVVRQWGNEYCTRFEEYGNAGLPEGWILFSGKDPSRSCAGIDVLTISSFTRLHIRGGVKIGRGNTYLKAVPPTIMLENGTGVESVTLNDEALTAEEGETNIWRIPDYAPVEEPLRIEATTPEERLRRVIRLEAPHLPPTQEYINFQRNPAGIPTDEGVPYAAGAVVYCLPEDEPPLLLKPLPLHLSSHVTIIGAVPGQIAILPDEPVPEWKPVWAIIKTGRKQARAIFCGTEEEARTPYTAPEPLENKALVHHWKEAVWHRRRRIIQPTLRSLKDRWNEYMEAGKRVR